jgi:hypothetical protein
MSQNTLSKRNDTDHEKIPSNYVKSYQKFPKEKVSGRPESYWEKSEAIG